MIYDLYSNDRLLALGVMGIEFCCSLLEYKQAGAWIEWWVVYKRCALACIVV